MSCSQLSCKTCIVSVSVGCRVPYVIWRSSRSCMSIDARVMRTVCPCVGWQLFPETSFAFSTGNMSQHDVDVPLSLRPRVGTLLTGFRAWLRANKSDSLFRIYAKDKEEGGHVTPWWLHVVCDERRTRKSQLQFGETVHPAVNSTPHLWVRGSPDLERPASPCCSFHRPPVFGHFE